MFAPGLSVCMCCIACIILEVKRETDESSSAQRLACGCSRVFTRKEQNFPHSFVHMISRERDYRHRNTTSGFERRIMPGLLIKDQLSVHTFLTEDTVQIM